MLFSLLKHYLDLYISDTALKVSHTLYCFTTSVCHGVENYFPRLWGTGISDAIFMSADLSVSWHYVVTLRRGRTRTRPREQLLLQNYKA